MASSNNRLRKPIALHRQTRTVHFGKGKVLIQRRAGQRAQTVKVR